MSTLLSRLLFVALALALFVASLLISAFAGRSAIEPETIAGFAHIVRDGYVSVGLLDLGDGEFALIDAGQDASGKAILAELAAQHADANAVVAIFLTHGHGDHMGAIGQFPRAKVYALEAEVPAVEGRAGFHGPLTRWKPASPTGIHVARALRDGDTVRVSYRAVRVFAVPGHTAGSAAYWVDGVLFLGDSAAASSDGKVLAAPWVFSDDVDQNKVSLRALATRLQKGQFDVLMLVFAHSGPIKGREALEAFGQTKE